LKTDRLYDKISDMISERDERYMACADEVIFLTDTLSVQDIADKIIASL
jgi:hypothetical protein